MKNSPKSASKLGGNDESRATKSGDYVQSPLVENDAKSKRFPRKKGLARFYLTFTLEDDDRPPLSVGHPISWGAISDQPFPSRDFTPSEYEPIAKIVTSHTPSTRDTSINIEETQCDDAVY